MEQGSGYRESGEPHERSDRTRLGAVGLLGLLLGLFIGWVLWPVEWSDADLDQLSSDLRAEYVSAVADAYAASGGQDPVTALRRMQAFEDPVAVTRDAIVYFETQEVGDTNIREVNLRTLLAALGTIEPVAVTTNPTSTGAGESGESQSLNEPRIGWLNWLLVLLSAIVLVGGGIWIGLSIVRRRGQEENEDRDEAVPAGRIDFWQAQDQAQASQPSMDREDDKEGSESASRQSSSRQSDLRPSTSERDSQPARDRAAGVNQDEADDYEDEDDYDPTFAPFEPDETDSSSGQSEGSARESEQSFPSFGPDPYAEEEIVFQPPVILETDLRPDPDEEAPDPPISDRTSPPAQEEERESETYLRIDPRDVVSAPLDVDPDDEIGEADRVEAEEELVDEEEADAPVRPERRSDAGQDDGFVDRVQDAFSSILGSRSSGAEDAMATFRGEYTFGIADYEESFTIRDPETGEPLGSCGMGVASELDPGGHEAEEARVFDVWLYDNGEQRSQNQLVVSPGVDKSSLAEDAPSTGTVTGDPLDAEPELSFRLKTKRLSLQCSLEQVEFLDREGSSKPFSRLDVLLRIERS